MADSDLEGRERNKRFARESVKGAITDLTANLIRIARGAGKPWEVSKQTVELLKAFQEYAAAAGHLPPPDQISEMLDIAPPVRDEGSVPADYAPRDGAEQEVIRGALQVAASRLLGQTTQTTAGNHEMYSGINRVVELRQKENERLAERTPAEAKLALAEALNPSKSKKRPSKR